MRLVEDFALTYGLNLDELHQDILGGDVDDVSVLELERSTEWLVKGSGKPWLPLELGAKIDFFQLGVFGRLVASCTCYRDAIELSRSYHELLHPMHDTEIEIQGKKLGYFYRTNRAVNYKSLYAEIALGAIPYWGERLTGKPMIPEQVCFRLDEPDYGDMYREHFKCEVLFSQPVDCLWMNSEVLDRPILSASPNYHAGLVKEAAEQLKHMSTWSAKVKDMIKLCLPSDISIGQAASTLYCSERTLQRKLSDEDVSFKVLKQEVRHEEAARLLEESALSVEQIAFHLGYEQRSSFAAAFKKQTGVSPGKWRSDHK